ncbi:hypothetical protein [Paenibacillus sp. FSL H8-0034]|uniref:hypothetical protein n=1 Tax=Paenibacillus sp. FSL H8-0034 TaxID=2954671 RepID=UPI0030F57181
MGKRVTGHVLFCVNNFGKHTDTKAWILQYRDFGWNVEVGGCMGLCRECRSGPMCMENESWEPKKLGEFVSQSAEAMPKSGYNTS